MKRKNWISYSQSLAPNITDSIMLAHSIKIIVGLIRSQLYPLLCGVTPVVWKATLKARRLFLKGYKQERLPNLNAPFLQWLKDQ